MYISSRLDHISAQKGLANFRFPHSFPLSMYRLKFPELLLKLAVSRLAQKKFSSKGEKKKQNEQLFVCLPFKTKRYNILFFLIYMENKSF
jgi:hypothetical protein